MAEKTKKYAVKVKSRRNEYDTIMRLTPEQAEELGGVEYVKGKEKAAPANKARSASNKSGRSGSRRAASKPAAKPAEKPTAAAPSGDAGSATAAE